MRKIRYLYIAFVLMFIYIFGTATEEQLGYNLQKTGTSDLFHQSRVENLTKFCLKKKSSQRVSKLSLVAKINQKTVGVCLIPKAASTTIRMVPELDLFLVAPLLLGNPFCNSKV